MPIDFEDDLEDEFSEGMDIVAQHLLESLVHGPTSNQATLSDNSRRVAERSTVTRSESARTFPIQRATPPFQARQPSPMQVDSNEYEMEVENPPIAERFTAKPQIANTRSQVENPPIAEGFTPKPHIANTRSQVENFPIVTTAKSSVADTLSRANSIPAKRPSPSADMPPSTVTSPSSSFEEAQPAAKRSHPSRIASRRSPGQSQGSRDNGSPLGTNLKPFIIAHDENTQQLLDAARIAWGTVYELARGVTKGFWDWSAVTPDRIQRLCGSNAEAAGKVASVMLARNVVSSLRQEEIWLEMDREQRALMENEGRGLGGMGPWGGKDNWYGGRIQQVGRLLHSKGHFSIQLEKPEIRRSHRFSRFLGSRRILQVKVSSDLLRDELGHQTRTLLSSSRFILCGRVFLPFHAKEGSAYLLETDQDFQRSLNEHDGDLLRISLKAFVHWHNPFAPNENQPISKWATRWALGLSTSVPTLAFEPNNIFFIDDEYVSPQDWTGKPPSEKVLTDGCGWINGSALAAIMRTIKYSSRPTAVQGRIGGSKGMWLLHPDPLEQGVNGPAKIWIRSSQTKIQLGKPSRLGSAQLKFDLLAPSRVTSPSRLNSQLLLNLSYNGIDHALLKDLLSLGLQEEIQCFMPEDWSIGSLIAAWKTIERSGNVVAGRVRKMVEGQARALGLGQIRPREDLENEDEDEDEPDSSLSIRPLTLHESVLELLQSGFRPDRLEVLFEKMEKIMTLVLDSYVEKFHIPLIESCEAYIVPDPFGVLEEGQIHFRSSSSFTNSVTGEQIDIILGDVLVSRSPTRLPSDVQKVKAVAHPQLSNYYDVIVFPIKGVQSLASYLGGGDYDGDTVMIIWHKQLVEQFKGSPLCGAPQNLFASFEREVEKVRDFDERVSEKPSQDAQQALQSVLLLGLAETKVGLYSTFHDAAVYQGGYGSEQAIHLAYMFTTCLDASKTGLRVKEDVFEEHRKTWGSREKKPWYSWKLEQAMDKGSKSINKAHPKRQHPPFILDELVEEGEKLKQTTLTKYRQLKSRYFPNRDVEDQDLLKPWQTAKAKAIQARDSGFSGFLENLKNIEAHVNTALEDYQRACVAAESSGSFNSFDKVASSFSKPPAFHGFQFYSDQEVRVLKASFAALKRIKFAFSVASSDLCFIKAQASQGGNVAMTHEFAQCMTIPNIVTRALTQTQD